MSTKLHWIAGPWRGNPATAARPRRADWLEDELRGWKNAGVNTVLSLLTTHEERDLGLSPEGQVARELGLRFASLPIPDRKVPSSPSEAASILDELDAELAAG